MYDDDQGSVVWSMMRFMHRMHNVLHSRLMQIGLFRGQPPVLHFLCEKGPMSQKELADKLSLSPATMTVTLKRMEKAGLVKRHTDPSDQRVQLVNVTGHGREMNGKARKVLLEIHKDCVEGLTQEEKDIIMTYIDRMSDNLGREAQKRDTEG